MKPANGFGLALAAAAMVAAMAQTAAAAGSIRSITACDPETGHREYGTNDPVRIGEALAFKVRLLNFNTNCTSTGGKDNPWRFRPRPGVDEALAATNPPAMGLWIGGRKRCATIRSVQPSLSYYTDLVFEYVVQSGDQAQPVRFCNADGSGPLADSPGQLYPLENVGPGSCWVLTDEATGTSCEFSFGSQALVPASTDGFAYPPSGWSALGEVRDYDLSRAGIYVNGFKDIAATVTGCAAVYDGQGHGVTVAVSDPDDGAALRFARGTLSGPTDAWSATAPMFTNACDATVWVEISAEGYATVTNHADVTITNAPLTIAAKDQAYAYNGQTQGEGDTAYATPGDIAEKVAVSGLAAGDGLASIILDGQGADPGTYPLVPSGATVTNAVGAYVTDNYAIGYTNGTLTIREPPPPFVSNVVARQRWPWNGLVDVDYEVGGDTNLLAGLEAQIVFQEQGGAGRSWVASNFLAGAEPSAEPGFHRATWDTAADGATNVVAAEVVATVALVRPASCGRLALDFGGLGVRTDAASYRATLYDNAGNPTKDPLTAAIGDAPPPDAVFDDVPSSTRKAVVEFLDEGGNVLCETAVEGDAFPRLPPGGEAVVPVLEGDAVTLRVAHAWPAETETADVRIVYDDGAEKRVFVEGAGFDAAAGSCEAVFRAAGGAASVKSVTLLRDGVPFEWLDYAAAPASANGALELDVDGNEFANGAYADGTAMQVANPRHLDNVRNHLGGSFKQIQDIDFAGSCGITNAIAVDKSDDGTDIACTRCDLDATVRFYGGADNVYGWTPIGDGEASPFSGTYDGNGCRIAGLVGNAAGRRDSVCALFGWAIGTTAKPAVVKNVIIADDCSFAASLSAAPLVGEGGGHLEIAGCETAGDVYSAQYAAGVLAEAYRDSDLQLKITGCTVDARIHGKYVAGVASWCSGGSASLSKCIFGEDGAAIGSWAVGGLVYHAGLHATDSFVIDECHSLGTLSIPSTHDENRTSSHGGFIGCWASEGSLTIDGQCEVKARFDFEGSADRIGGVIGYCSRGEGVSDDQLKNRMKNIFTAHVSVDSGCLVAFEDRKIGTYAGDPWLDAL